MEIGNGVTFVGRLVRDLEVKITPNNVKYINFTLARTRRKSQKNEDPESDFVDCTAFGIQAEFAEKYFKKGERVGVYGRLSTHIWEKDNVKGKSTVILVDGFEFMGSSTSSFKKDNNNEMDVNNDTSITMETADPINDDDLPF